jgi:hypothetical protein
MTLFDQYLDAIAPGDSYESAERTLSGADVEMFLRRIRDVVFKRPVAVGEQIRVGCEVLSTRPLDDQSGLVECDWRIIGPDGRLRARATVEVLWRRSGVDDDLDGTSPVRANGDGVEVLI